MHGKWFDYRGYCQWVVDNNPQFSGDWQIKRVRMYSALANHLKASDPGVVSRHSWSAGPNGITHPIFQVSNPAQLTIDQLDCLAFKSLNDRYLSEDFGRYYRTEIIDIEEKALGSDRLSKLLIGRSPLAARELIGLPRITAGRGVDENVAEDGQNWLYFFGYMPLAVRVTYNSNRCIDAHLCLKGERKALEKAAFLELKKYALGKSAAEVEEYLHHKLGLCNVPPPGVDPGGIPLFNGGPAEKYFDVGRDYNWNFHFIDGKCAEILESYILS